MMPSAASSGAAQQQQRQQQNKSTIISNGQQQQQQSMVAPSQVPPQTLQATKTKLAHVLYALEDLRLEYLHSSVGGLPLPTTHQLEALARLRPSSLNAFPDGVIPTWSRMQTTTFGNVFLECLWKASQATGLSLDAYLMTATNEQVGNDDQDQGPLPPQVMNVVTAFNLGHPTNQIAKQYAIDESSVLVYLLQAEDRGTTIQWSRMTVSACLKDAVEIAAEVARHLEKAAMEQRGAVGGVAGQRKEPLSTRFPLSVLMQLLPDWRPVDVLAGICLVRHQRQTRLSARRRRVPPRGAAAATGITTAVAAVAKMGQVGVAAATSGSLMGGVKRPAESMVVNNENQGPRATAYATSSKDATKPMQQQEEQQRRAFSPFAQQQQQQQYQQLTQPVVDKPANVPPMQHQHQHQHQHQQHQHQQHQQHQPQPPSNPAASIVPLPRRILTLLQVHAADGLSSAECCELLASADRSHHHAHALDSKAQAAVDACLGALEESYVAYRGADGKFKLL